MHTLTCQRYSQLISLRKKARITTLWIIAAYFFPGTLLFAARRRVYSSDPPPSPLLREGDVGRFAPNIATDRHIEIPINTDAIIYKPYLNLTSESHPLNFEF